MEAIPLDQYIIPDNRVSIHQAEAEYSYPVFFIPKEPDTAAPPIPGSTSNLSCRVKVDELEKFVSRVIASGELHDQYLLVRFVSLFLMYIYGLQLSYQALI